MSKSEKRFFKISASKHVIGDKNNYVMLFDFIANQKDQDDEAIKKKFKTEKFVKRLAAAKYDLYKLVLKSLAEYHSTDSTKGQLRDYLQSAQVLLDKALYEQSDKILKSAKVLAYKYDEFRFLLEIIDQELKVIKRKGTTIEMRHLIEELEDEAQDIMQRLFNISAFDLIGSNTQKLMNSKGRPRNDHELAEYHNVINVPQWELDEESLTNMEKIHCYHAKSLWYFAVKDIEKSYYYTNKRVELYETYPDQITDHSSFMAALYNLEVTSNTLQKYKEGQKIRLKLRNFETTYPQWKLTENNRVQLFKSLNNELIYFINSAQYEKGEALIDEITGQLDSFRNKLGRSDEVILFYNIVNLFLYSNKPNAALKWMSKLLSHEAVSYREDVHSFARILNLIIHYEIGNYDSLPYFTKSTYRYLRKGERTFKIESLLLDFIRKTLPNTVLSKKKQVTSAFANLKSDILEIIENDPYEKGCLDYFDLLVWLDSKVNNTTFKEEYIKAHPDRVAHLKEYIK